MSKVKPGDKVAVSYNGRLSNDEIFESSEDTGPLEFIIGAGEVLAGFEENIIGMTEGEHKTFTLPPEQANGSSRPDLIHTISKQTLKQGQELRPGMVLGLTIEQNGQTNQMPAMVTAINDDSVIVDFNHPLAGKTLTYQVTVQKIHSA